MEGKTENCELKLHGAAESVDESGVDEQQKYRLLTLLK